MDMAKEKSGTAAAAGNGDACWRRLLPGGVVMACPSPVLSPGETLGSVRRARQWRRLGAVPFLEALPRCSGCVRRSSWFVASPASAVRLGVPSCHARAVAEGMSIRGAMYSIINTSPTVSSPSQAISRCPLADPLGTKGGECVELVWLGVFVVF
jgi:hypothetical protein